MTELPSRRKPKIRNVRKKKNKDSALRGTHDRPITFDDDDNESIDLDLGTTSSAPRRIRSPSALGSDSDSDIENTPPAKRMKLDTTKHAQTNSTSTSGSMGSDVDDSPEARFVSRNKNILTQSSFTTRTPHPISTLQLPGAEVISVGCSQSNGSNPTLSLDSANLQDIPSTYNEPYDDYSVLGFEGEGQMGESKPMAISVPTPIPLPLLPTTTPLPSHSAVGHRLPPRSGFVSQPPREIQTPARNDPPPNHSRDRATNVAGPRPTKAQMTTKALQPQSITPAQLTAVPPISAGSKTTKTTPTAHIKPPVLTEKQEGNQPQQEGNSSKPTSDVDSVPAESISRAAIESSQLNKDDMARIPVGDSSKANSPEAVRTYTSGVQNTQLIRNSCSGATPSQISSANDLLYNALRRANSTDKRCPARISPWLWTSSVRSGSSQQQVC
jgi:hypothetical protein